MAIGLDALSLEQHRGEVALRDGVAGLRRGGQPAFRHQGITLDAHAFGEAGADVVAGACMTGPGERFPDR